MRHYRLSACDCGSSHYRLLPRHWWMRALGTRRRYQCKQCGALMLLRTEGAQRRMRGWSVLLVLLALVAAAYVSFYAVEYREDWSYQSWKRWAERQGE